MLEMLSLSLRKSDGAYVYDNFCAERRWTVVLCRAMRLKIVNCAHDFENNELNDEINVVVSSPLSNPDLYFM